EMGFKVRVIPTKKHPLLFAILDNGSSETYGFYSHYDVQPPEPLDQWKSPPFELTETDGKLVGRGTADDKGHIAQVIFAVKQAQEKKKLNKNIFLIYEGEEEIGSQNFEPALLTIQKTLQKADVFFILDSSTRDIETPMIEYGLRGLLYYELTVTLSHKDLHSGLYGNLVENPANIVTQLLSSIKNIDGFVTIPHFYDTVLSPSSKEISLLKKTKPSKDQDIQSAGVKDLVVPKGSHFALASKVLPSFDINGMISGYTGEGAKTIIPAKASAKFSFRLVPNQDPVIIGKLFQKFVHKFFDKKTLNYKLDLLSSDFPFLTLPDNKYIHITKKVFAKHFKNETLLNRSGGSIPAADTLSRLTKKPVVITGFTSPESNLHSPNEFIDARLFQKGIDV
ncbi:MAG: M20/M25/M40 family metallo-hydrolase, partial [Patescibacteria group bacterium]